MTQTNGKIYHNQELEELILLNDDHTQDNICIPYNSVKKLQTHFLQN